jgi:secondary thiamine-phosphate synthase enzyme
MKSRFNPTPAVGKTLGVVGAALVIHTRGPGFTDITNDVSDWLKQIGATDGLLTVFIAHTSASLTIQENADPDVRRDLIDCLSRLAPESHPYRHASEGPDDMPAHIKAMLTSVSLSIPVVAGRTALGTWQGVYVIEHRARDHDRRVEMHFIGVCETALSP